MRLGVIGGFPSYLSSSFTLVHLSLGDSLIGPFAGFVFCSYSQDADSILSDSWLALAVSFRESGYPVFWNVIESSRWVDKAELILSSAGVYVVDSLVSELLLLEHFESFTSSLFSSDSSESAVYVLRFDSSNSLPESLALTTLLALPDAEDFLKDLIIEELQKRTEEED